MKDMMLVDALMSKSILRQQLILSLVVAVFICFTVGNVYMIVPLFACLTPLSTFFALAMIDEQGSWESYRLALSFGRKQIVCGRYAYLLLLSIVSTLAALALIGLLLAIGPYLGSSLPVDFSRSLANMSWQMLLALSVAPACALLLILAIVLPITFRMGMSKAMVWMPMLIILLTIGVGAFIQNADILQNPDVARFISWIMKPEGTVATLTILAAVAFAAYAASCSLAVRIYRKRQF